MKKLNRKFAVLLALPALLAVGCTVDQPDSPLGLEPPVGEEIFANFVAIGNSLTAGYMDGGLMVAGQMSSYPRLIAGSLGLANAPGDMEFSQPWVNSPGIGSAAASDPAHIAGVYFFDRGTGSLGILGETAYADLYDDLLLAETQPTPYNNLGVPGAALYDVMNAYSSTTCGSYVNFDTPNPYFDFINRVSLYGNETSPAGYETASMFGQCVAKGPTLATVWIGNNDVLGGATAGTVVPGVTITEIESFGTDYTTMLMTLAGGLLERTGFPATIVVANIPSITDIPYFVPKATFEAAILGGAWPGGYEEDVAYFRFPAASWAAEGNYGTAFPASYTLSTAEATSVATAVAGYNAAIAGAVTMVNGSGMAHCGLVDTNALMAGLAGPQKTHFMFLVGTLGIDDAAATTLFSLDGIHPNNSGYAVVAQAFVDVIADLTGTDLPSVPAQTWYPTYGHPGTTVTDGAADTAARIDGAMARLFR